MSQRGRWGRRAGRAPWLRTSALLLAGSMPLGMPLGAQQRSQAPPLAIRGVTVVDVNDGRLLAKQTVVIVGNRIDRMGAAKAVRVPAGARVIDGQGKYLIPGLWDMHAHPTLLVVRKDGSLRTTDRWYPLFVANGITGIRDAGSAVPLDTLALWKRKIATGAWVGPRMIVGGQAIDQNAECVRRSTDFHTCVSSPADARHLVDSLKAAGADFLKTYSMSSDMYFALAAAARRAGIPFGGHLAVVRAIDASDSGASILDHTGLTADAGLGEPCFESTATVEQCHAMAERLRRNGTWWVPTRMYPPRGAGVPAGKGARSEPIFEYFDDYVRRFFFSDSAVKSYSLQLVASTSAPAGNPPGPSADPADSLGFLQVAQRAGVPILAGTDAAAPMLWPGFSLHAELATYAAEGLTPLGALQAATLNPAKYLHGTDSLGTVAAGKLADLVLLDANPLADVANTTKIRAVVANGRYFDRAALDRLLAEVRAEARRVMTETGWGSPP